MPNLHEEGGKMRALKMTIEEFRDEYIKAEVGEEFADDVVIAGDEKDGWYFRDADGRDVADAGVPAYISEQPWSYRPDEVMDNAAEGEGWYAYIDGRFYEMPWLEESEDFSL